MRQRRREPPPSAAGSEFGRGARAGGLRRRRLARHEPGRTSRTGRSRRADADRPARRRRSHDRRPDARRRLPGGRRGRPRDRCRRAVLRRQRMLLAARVVALRGADRRSARRRQPDHAEHCIGHQRRPAEGRDPELRIGLRAHRVVDLGDDRPNLEHLGRELGRHDVSVVAFGHRQEDVRARGTRPPQDRLIGSVAADRRAPKAGWQAVERDRRYVDDRHVVAGRVQDRGQERADPAATDDDRFHAGTSMIGSRTTHTSQGAFLRT